MEGKRFGKWTVLNFIQIDKPGKHYECKCECGNIGVISGVTLRAKRSTQCMPCMYEERDNPSGMIGKKFGSWTVLKWIETKNRLHRYQTQCECGSLGTHYGSDLRRSRQKGKQCKSCGDKQASITNTIHGRHRDPIYKTWASMIYRCTNPNATHYYRYGGRGIKVCDEWRSFVKFLEDMGEVPEGLTLDRIDNNGDYSKKNCRWITHKENCNNRYY